HPRRGLPGGAGHQGRGRRAGRGHLRRGLRPRPGVRRVLSQPGRLPVVVPQSQRPAGGRPVRGLVPLLPRGLRRARRALTPVARKGAAARGFQDRAHGPRPDAAVRGHPAAAGAPAVARDIPADRPAARRPDPLLRARRGTGGRFAPPRLVESFVWTAGAGAPAAFGLAVPDGLGRAGCRAQPIPSDMPRWLLPESIADVLPSEARRIEELRRSLLDLYRRYGYELVMPPLVEYLGSLLTGAGSTLEIRTAQLVDQSSGRRLGVRADMTPQVARIDAHLLGRKGPSRLCYAGPVLHARPADPFASRVPYQIGAELYGHAGQEAELEVLDLMLSSLRVAGLDRLRVDLCHAGIVPALLERAPHLDAAAIYRMMVQKDVGSLREMLAGTDPVVAQALLALPSLYGAVNGATSVLDRAAQVLPDIDAIGKALADLRRLVSSSLWKRLEGVELAVDLADLSGYHYYSGISFAAYS